MGAPSPAGRTLLEKTSTGENLRPTAYSLSASLNEGRGPRGVRAKEVHYARQRESRAPLAG
ncbi:MAG: hypothetical protein JWO23_1889 [Solirubrobacterales bacterium]|nr:hypothetical protein [Solirubrobacterales bacterium]